MKLNKFLILAISTVAGLQLAGQVFAKNLIPHDLTRPMSTSTPTPTLKSKQERRQSPTPAPAKETLADQLEKNIALVSDLLRRHPVPREEKEANFTLVVESSTIAVDNCTAPDKNLLVSNAFETFDTGQPEKSTLKVFQGNLLPGTESSNRTAHLWRAKLKFDGGNPAENGFVDKERFLIATRLPALPATWAPSNETGNFISIRFPLPQGLTPNLSDNLGKEFPLQGGTIEIALRANQDEPCHVRIENASGTLAIGQAAPPPPASPAAPEPPPPPGEAPQEPALTPQETDLIEQIRKDIGESDAPGAEKERNRIASVLKTFTCPKAAPATPVTLAFSEPTFAPSETCDFGAGGTHKRVLEELFLQPFPPTDIQSATFQELAGAVRQGCKKGEPKPILRVALRFGENDAKERGYIMGRPGRRDLIFRYAAPLTDADGSAGNLVRMTFRFAGPASDFSATPSHNRGKSFDSPSAGKIELVVGAAEGDRPCVVTANAKAKLSFPGAAAAPSATQPKSVPQPRVAAPEAEEAPPAGDIQGAAAAAGGETAGKANKGGCRSSGTEGGPFLLLAVLGLLAAAARGRKNSLEPEQGS